MSLLERFRTLGGKLGILAVAPAKPKAEPVKLEMRTVTLSELTQELGAPDLSKLAEAPEFLNLSWPEVYAAAGVQPPEHGWGVEKLAATLKSEAYAKLERTAVQAELARLFVSQEAVLETVQEAVARDQALDRFELAARMKLDQRAARRKKDLADLRQRFEELREALAKMERQVAEAESDDAKHWFAWRERKREAERELAWTVSFLLKDQVISTGEDPAPRPKDN